MNFITLILFINYQSSLWLLFFFYKIIITQYELYMGALKKNEEERRTQMNKLNHFLPEFYRLKTANYVELYFSITVENLHMLNCSINSHHLNLCLLQDLKPPFLCYQIPNIDNILFRCIFLTWNKTSSIYANRHINKYIWASGVDIVICCDQIIKQVVTGNIICKKSSTWIKDPSHL